MNCDIFELLLNLIVFGFLKKIELQVAYLFFFLFFCFFFFLIITGSVYVMPASEML